MNEFLIESIDFIIFLQQFRNIFLDVFFKFITLFGNVEFFIVTLPLLYWCYDYRKSFYLTFIFLIDIAINTFFKHLFQLPRPFLIAGYENINLIEQSGFSLPSTHAQASILFYGILSTWFQKNYKYILLFVFPFLIGFSRIYLGVHYPSDVLLGWIVGLIIFLLFMIFNRVFIDFIKNYSFLFKNIFIFVTVLILYLINQDDMIIPGLFLGACFGYNIMTHYFEFEISKKYLNRLLAYIIGVAGILVIYILLKNVFPQKSSSIYQLFRFIRYAMLGFWITAVAPWIFIRTGIYKRVY